MLIAHARWVDPDGREQSGALRIDFGKVFPEVGNSAPTRHPEDIDASGLLILPGLVDAHTHLREPGQAYKEGIANGSLAALKGGVTTLLDMPNNAPPITTSVRLEEKRALFRGHCQTHWGLHVQAPVEDPERLGPHASAKLYMAKSSELPAVRDVDTVRGVLATHRRVAVHAEDDLLFREATVFDSRRSHHLQRPIAAVSAALLTLERALASLPEAGRPRLILCHASTAIEVAWLERMKAAGFDVWGETCPHYLLFCDEDYVREGPRLKVNPPLRSADDREAVRQALALGVVDFVSSDHAPHAPDEKADEARAPSGIPGIEWMAPALLHLVDQKLLDWRRFIEVSAARASRAYGIADRGGVAAGQVADLTLVKRAIDARPPLTRAGYAPYAGIGFGWRVEMTLLAGRKAFAHGESSSPALGTEVIA